MTPRRPNTSPALGTKYKDKGCKSQLCAETPKSILLKRYKHQNISIYFVARPLLSSRIDAKKFGLYI